MTWVLTHSGMEFDLSDPQPDPIVRHYEKAVRFNFLNMYYDLGGK